ncbi:MAG: TIGR00282 family metallophosphoesterase [Chloroflexota bacterium]
MRILFIGDIVGKPGRDAVRLFLPRLTDIWEPDVVIANGENLVGGAGVNRETATEMLGLGIAALTGGNHIFQHREGVEYLAENPPVLRPLNYPPGAPGLGSVDVPVGDSLLTVINLQGRVFMPALDDPFRAADAALSVLPDDRAVLIDMHAEATAEKQALAHYLDGRASAIVGTHTHVPTADARLLPKGTAYISDVGMVGPRNSVIGSQAQPVVRRYLTQMYERFQPATGPVDFNAVLIDLDEAGTARDIRLLQEIVQV